MGKTSTNAGAVEFANPVALLKIRLQKWTINNKEKKQLMDMYIRNVKIIEDAFVTIKSETGISSTEEIVTTFIKAEEQNQNLFNYINTLASDIDMIEEQNKDIESSIKRHEEIAQMNGKEKDAVKQNLAKEIEDMNDKKEKKETQIGDIESQLATIKSYVENTVNLFRESQMKLTVAQPM